MKKIMFVTTGLNTGGAEQMLYSLVSQLDRDRFSPSVVSLIAGGEVTERLQQLKVPVYSIGLKAGRLPDVGQLFKLRSYTKRIEPDIIQGWMYHGNLAASLSGISLSNKVPIYWSIHHSIKSLAAEKFVLRNIIKLGAKFSAKCRKVIFVSHASKSQHEAIGYSAGNSCVIPNGFNLETFAPSDLAKQKLTEELGLDEDAILIGNFARYHPMKDHANLLKAASLLVSKYPKVNFVLAGNNIDLNNAELTNLIKELVISDRVHLLGKRQDMAHLTAALDIATLSSAYGEAFPLVIGEAMSCQVPCAVTDVGDAAEIVGDTGKVVPPLNPEALATAWSELIELGDRGREKLGIAARKRVLDCFSLPKIVGQYEQLWSLNGT